MLNEKQINILPTYTDLPRILKGTHVIPKAYLYYLEAYLNEINRHKQIIFSPKFPYGDSREYLLTYADNKLIYLEKFDGMIVSHEIDMQKIVSLKLSEDILDAKYIVYYVAGDQLKTLEIKYNNATHKLYEDIFDVVLNAKNEVVDNRSKELRDNRLALYNYAYKGLKLGEIETYHYLDLYYVDYDNEVVKVEVLIMKLNKGRVLITKDNNKVDTWFILDNKIKLDIINHNGLNNIIISIEGNEVLNLKSIK